MNRSHEKLQYEACLKCIQLHLKTIIPTRYRGIFSKIYCTTMEEL